MPEMYDFLYELAYKALLFEDMGEKRVYTDRLEELIKKLFSFVVREDPDSLDKFIFIIDWVQNKSSTKEYEPRCLFLASRYIFFIIMDAIEAEL